MPQRHTPLHVDQLLANLDGVRRLAGALVRDPADADDLAQDAALAALASPPSAGWNMRSWLNGVVRNKARRLKRTAVRRQRREVKAARAELVPTTIEVAVRVAEQRRVLDAVTRLSSDQQQVIWLRYFEELPPRVIALRLDIPVETVRTRTKRALLRLRRELEEQHGSSRGAWITALGPLLETGRASSNTSWIGATVMSAKSKVVVVALVIAALCFGIYHLLAEDANEVSRLKRADSGPTPTSKRGGETNATLTTGPPAATESTAAPTATTPTTRVEGVVIALNDNSPVEGARVYCASLTETAVTAKRTVQTDAEGRFVLSVSGAAPVVVHVIANGFLAWREDEAITASRKLVVCLERGAAIEGRVLDQRNQPIPGARVWCHLGRNHSAWPHTSSLWMTHGGSSGAETVADQDGVFRLTGLEPGVRYVVDADRRRWHRWGTSPLVRSDSRDVVVRMRELARLAVRAIDSRTGQPIPSAKIMFFQPKGALPATRLRLRDPADSKRWETTVVGAAQQLAYFADNSVEQPSATTTLIRVVATGYQNTRARMDVRFGESVSLDVPLEPASDADFVPVYLDASFGDGAPYTGPLLVNVGVSTFRLTIEQGRATEKILLPPGRHVAVPQGAGTVGRWWHRAGAALEIDVRAQRGKPARHQLRLAGNPARILVRDAEGRSVRDYRLGVWQESKGRGWMPRWAAHARRDLPAYRGANPEQPVFVWMKPGPNRIRVNAEGLGHGEALVRAAGNGAPLEIEIQLDPAAELDFRTPPR